MGGTRRDSGSALRPLAWIAAGCFAAMIAFAGVRNHGAYAVVSMDPSLTADADAEPTVPPSTDAEPDARGEPAGTRLPAATPATTTATTTVATTPTEAPPITSAVESVPPTTLLADLLGEINRGAALPDDVEPRTRPIGLATSEFDLGGIPVRAVGIEDDGELEVPDETEIGWYQYGSTAGQPGATVLAAHVSWNGTTGPFFELDTLEPGSQVEVALDDGTTRTYDVIEQTKYDKDQLPRERIWRNTGPETLVLITCGGDFNPEIRRYRQNIVVYAVPAG